LQAAGGGFQSALAEIRSSRWRLGRGLIVGQAAISLLLLIGAGLFGRTLHNMYSQDPGFNRRGILTFWLDATKAGYKGDKINALYQRVFAELRSLPGVISASSAFIPPISRLAWDGSMTVEGYTHGEQESDESHLNTVAPDYFRALGTRLLLGREFDERDTAASKKVAIINESFARYYFKNRSPLGRWLARIGPDREKFEIVGVVKDMKYRDLRLAPPRTVYFASTQSESARGWNCVVVRTTTDAAAMLRSIETAVERVDRALRVLEPRTMDELMSRSLLHERILAMLAACFGGLALVLAAVGIYGVMAFQVARRRKEIGIRMALGARPREVVAMVVGQTARLVLYGSAVGIPCALGLTRVTEKTLYGIEPTDPATFVGAVAGLALVAVVAAYLPGRAATRINPVESLRCE
jgi:predicted permease